MYRAGGEVTLPLLLAKSGCEYLDYQGFSFTRKLLFPRLCLGRGLGMEPPFFLEK